MARPKDLTWFRIYAEAFVIVLSILLAFGIEAWWDDQEEREDAQRLLSSILDEYRLNLEVIEQRIAHRKSVRDSINRIFELADAAEKPDQLELDDLLGAITWATAPTGTWGALDALVEGGQLRLIENQKLRVRLSVLHRSKDLFATTEQTDTNFLENVLSPYLRENALLPQIGTTRSAIYWPGGDPTKPLYEFDLILPPKLDHSPLLEDREFLGIVFEKLWIQLDALRRNEAFMEDSVELIALLEAEIDDA
jgi:hypothetical protein